MSELKKTATATARHFRNLESMNHTITLTKANDTTVSISVAAASSVSPARRLRDGAVVTDPSSSSTRGSKRKGSHLDFSSTTTTTKSKSNHTNTKANTSIEEALLAATSSTSKGARLLRQGWRTAVNSMYEQNQAVARLTSIQGRRRTVMFRVSLHKYNTSNSTLYMKYPKGVQGRSNQYYEDILPELIDIEVLKSVISSLRNITTNDDTNPEVFRPTNLSLLGRTHYSSCSRYNTRIDRNQGCCH